jgi:Transposase DDE domain
VAAGTQVQVGEAWRKWPSWLQSLRPSVFDGWTQLGQTDPLPVRLIARRCPAVIASERRRRCHARAKKACRGKASRLQLTACDWQVWATNVPASLLSAEEVDTVYRCRWQIELFFKRAKSLGGWQIDVNNRADRVLVELWSKLLGVVVSHWLVLVRGGLLGGSSLWKLMKVVQEYAGRLRESVSSENQLTSLVEQLKTELERVPQQRRSRRKPLTFQTLQTLATANTNG